jgi:hypothetical protein
LAGARFAERLGTICAGKACRFRARVTHARLFATRRSAPPPPGSGLRRSHRLLNPLGLRFKQVAVGSSTFIRLFLALLIILSPVGNAAPAAAEPSVSCMMAGADEGGSPDHERMNCCTPKCATPCPSAILPLSALAGNAAPTAGLVAKTVVAAGRPLNLLSTEDPPPRPSFV